jgi:hypothetical protein
MGSCPKKHIRLPSSAEILCLISLACRNTTDLRFHFPLVDWILHFPFSSLHI